MIYVIFTKVVFAATSNYRIREWFPLASPGTLYLGVGMVHVPLLYNLMNKQTRADDYIYDQRCDVGKYMEYRVQPACKFWKTRFKNGVTNTWKSPVQSIKYVVFVMKFASLVSALVYKTLETTTVDQHM